MLFSFFSVISFYSCFAFAVKTTPTSVEPSDVVYWNNDIFVINDQGTVIQMDLDGNTKKTFDINGYDLEAITVIPLEKNMLYLGREYPATIIKYDYTQETIVKEMTLANFPESAKKGMESLVYLSKADVFLAGSQATGEIFVYENTQLKSQLSLFCNFKPKNGVTDLSSMTLDYNNVLYFLFDSTKKLLAMDVRNVSKSNVCNLGNVNTRLYNANLPNQEGIAFTKDFVFITEDSGDILRYTRTEFVSAFSNKI